MKIWQLSKGGYYLENEEHLAKLWCKQNGGTYWADEIQTSTEEEIIDAVDEAFEHIFHEIG